MMRGTRHTDVARARMSRAVRASWKKRARKPRGLGLRELRERSKPGECPFCGDPIPPRTPGRGGRTLTHCGDEVCFAAYNRFWRRDQIETRREAETRARRARRAKFKRTAGVFATALALLFFVACGPPEPPYFTGTLGEPCPGYGRSACDVERKITVSCNTDDGGVWEFERQTCGFGASVPEQDGGAP